jgi:hypothetical protein
MKNLNFKNTQKTPFLVFFVVFLGVFLGGFLLPTLR